MPISISRSGRLVSAVATMLTAITCVGVGIHLSRSPEITSKNLIDEVWQVIDKNYVDATFNQVDWTEVRNEYLSRDYTTKEQAYDAIREMLEKLEDPYTRFMNPEEFKNMQINTSGELTGVGIRLMQDEETEKLIVSSVIEDSPAFEAGLQAQDILTKIDSQSTTDMDISDASNLIRGLIGTQVTLTVKRDEQETDYPITRDTIEIHPVRYSKKDNPNGNIGYIRLNTFSANAPKEMEEAIEELESENILGYVLDLRSNPGGLLSTSIEITKMWLEQGDIVYTVNRDEESDRIKADNTALTDKPLVIIIDGATAGLSEILAGALKDNSRALLVGKKTYGYGSVQSVRKLKDGSGLAVTTAEYFTPYGLDINGEGIEPDVSFELTKKEVQFLRRNRDKIGTSADPQYVKAVEILTEEIISENQSY